MKTNRLISLLLTFTLLCSALVLPTSAAQPGEPMGWVLYTEIVAYIDGYPIRSYNIDGNTYVVVEDLMAYGFSVTWDPSVPRLVIGDRTGGVTSTYTPAENTGIPGMPAMPYLYTDITTWIYDTQVTGYNIGGYTVICMDDLARFYAWDYVWDPSGPALRMSVARAQPEPEPDPEPSSTPDLTPSASSPTERREMTAEEIYAACSPAVFYIEVCNAQGDPLSSGSGFFLNESGLAVTNCHVLMGGTSARVQVSDSGQWYDISAIYDFDISHDWAVFQVDGSGFTPLMIGDPATVKGGAAVYALGSPLGLQNSITAGIISNPARVDGGVTYIQTSAAISSGSSGGALINRYGEVIGITSASYTEGENVNLALPMSVIDGFTANEPIAVSELWKIARTAAYLQLEEMLEPLYNYDYFEDGTKNALALAADDSTVLYIVLGEINSEPCISLNLFSEKSGFVVMTELISYVFVDQMEVQMTVEESSYYSTRTHLQCSAVVESGCFCDFTFDEYSGLSPDYLHAQETMAASLLLQLVGCVEMLREAIDTGDGTAEWVLSTLGFWELML